MSSYTLRHLTVGQLHTNTFLLINEEQEKAAIIDPGDDADYIMRVLQDEAVVPELIIATHGHFDHILAVNELKLAYDIPFVIHEKDQFLVDRIRSTTKHFLPGVDSGPPPKVDKYLDSKNSLELVGQKVTILHTPGHTPGSVSLYLKDEGVCFVGDVIFEGGGVGRTDFEYANPLKLQDSIQKILQLPKETQLFSGHGDFTTVERERSFHQ